MLMQRKKTRMEEYMERRNKDKRFAAEAQEKKEEKPKVRFDFEHLFRRLSSGKNVVRCIILHSGKCRVIRRKS